MLASRRRLAALLAVSTIAAGTAIASSPAAQAHGTGIARPQSVGTGPKQPPPATTKPAAPTPTAFSLTLTPQRLVTLSADKARAADIGANLEKHLKVSVRMSPLVAGRLITLKLSRAPLEELLFALAPQVYLDYEVRWDRPQEEWVAVELTGLNEREPVTPVQPKAFIVIAGSTEDDSVTEETLAAEREAMDAEKLRREPPKEGPVLDVLVKDGLVSIRARRQMVTAILLEVASKAGPGFETRGQLEPGRRCRPPSARR